MTTSPASPPKTHSGHYHEATNVAVLMAAYGTVVMKMRRQVGSKESWNVFAELSIVQCDALIEKLVRARETAISSLTLPDMIKVQRR